jgi:phosphoglucosamine mutase
VRNLRVTAKPPLEDCPAIIQAFGEVEEALGSRGRIIMRYSGTEPLARIMIEGESEERIAQLADQMAAVLAQELGGVLV